MNKSTLPLRSGLFLILFAAFLAKNEAKTAFPPAENVCQFPVSLAANDLTSTSATLTWSVTNSPADTAWDVEFVLLEAQFSGQPSPGFAHISSFPVTVSNLESGRDYKFRVRSHAPCGTTAWSGSRAFRTRLTNPSRCGMRLKLDDFSCDPSSNHFPIEVNSAPGATLGMDVILKSFRILLKHNWDSDVKMTLISPSGKAVLLTQDLGTGDDHFGDTTDVSCTKSCNFSRFCPISPISNTVKAQPPFVGTWEPMGNFDDFNDGSSPVGLWRLEICDDQADHAGTLVFAEIEFARPDCLPPTDIAATVFSPSAVELFWTNAGACQDSIFIEYGPSGFVPGTGATAGNGGFLKKISCSQGQPFLLTGLAPLTSYDVYFRKKCGVGLPFSFNSCKKTVFTDCLAPTISEDFDGQSECGTACAAGFPPCPIAGFWKNVSGDEFDFRTHAGTTPTALTGPDHDASGGGKYAYIEPSCGNQNPFGKKGVLQSRCALVVANGACSMSFYHHMYGARVGFLRLEISTDGGLIWQNIWQKTGNQGNQWWRQFIDLTPFDGQIAIFRFIAQSSGPETTSDIALDDIRFFGSTDAGAPDYSFWPDTDGDGFGAGAAITACSPTVPTGYAANNLDCDDSKNAVNPSAAEILCNGLDDDCDGLADDDDVPVPAAFSVEKCRGERFKVWATSTAKGQHFWFSAASGGQFLGAGDTLDLGFLTASATVFLVDSFSNGGCSSARTAATATVRTAPDISVLQNPAICRGDFFDLASLSISDAASAMGDLTFHSASPATAGNQLASSNVSPSQSTSYVVKKATAFGCADETTAFLTVKNLPTATIQQGASLALCRGQQAFLGAGASGLPPFSFSWSGGNLGASAWNYFTLPIVGTATGGTSQTYFLTATDSAGCRDTAQIAVTTAASISAVRIDSVFDVSECGGANGRIELTPLNGSAPFNFYWAGPTQSAILNQPGGTTAITGLKQGSYQISVADASNCSMTLPAQVIAAPGLAVALDTIYNVSCAGGADGGIGLTVAGPSPIFQWNAAGQTGEDLQNVGAGAFSVTITSGACQVKLENLQITQPASIQLFLNKIDSISCFSAQNGAIDLGETGGAGGYSFSWTNGKTTEDLSVLGPGSYRATVTDARGCQKISNWVTLVEPPPMVVSVDSLHPISCSYTADGAIFLKRQGGNAGPTAFSWSNGQAQRFLTNLGSGLFSVTATDRKGCSAATVVDLVAPDPLGHQNILFDPPSCIGKADGQLWVKALGGTAPYQFFWSDGGTSPQRSGLEAGQLFLTITDSKSCVWSGPTSPLPAAQLIDFQVVSTDSVDCFGAFTGSVEVAVGGANPPFSTVWNGLLQGQNLTDVAAGPYTALVQDALGCRLKSDTVWVGGPANELSVQAISIENATCFGLTDGSIDLEATGGTAPFSAKWNGAATAGIDLTEVGAGIFAVEVRDARGCLFPLQNLEISQPNQILPNETVSQPPCLVGTGFGSIELAPTGGVGAVAAAWSNGSGATGIYSLAPGFYGATLTDAAGCSVELKPIEIFDPNASIRAQLIDFQAVSCSGAEDGRVVLKLEGGQLPFQLLWSNGQKDTLFSNLFSLENLPPDTISVAVLDANYCFALSDTAIIEEPSVLEGFYAAYQNPPCTGEASGFIQPTVSGGVPPYDFVWAMDDGGFSNKILLDSLPSGTYGVTATDNNGCAYFFPNIILSTPPTLLQIQLDSFENDRCGAANGFLNVSATGGQGPHFFEWSTSETTAAIAGLAAGFYAVSVSDAVGCQKTELFEIQQTDTLTVAANTFPVACRGDSTGWARLTATGGTPPYQFLWPNNWAQDSIFGLGGGIFHCSISDAGGCEAVVAVVISEPATVFKLDSVDTEPASAPGFFDGSACVFVSGGSLPYSFSWPQNPTTDACAGGLEAGVFSVTATDGYGCSLTISMVEISVPTGEADSFFDWKIGPNPTADFFLFESKTAENEPFSIEIEDVLGKTVFSKSGFSNEKIDARCWPSGPYFFKIRDEKGRTATRKLVVEK